MNLRDVVFVVLEIKTALVGCWAPIFVDKVMARINDPLWLRYIDTVESVLDRQALGDPELVASRLRRWGRNRAWTSLVTLIKKAGQLMQKYNRKQSIAFLAHANQSRDKIIRRFVRCE